MATVEGVSAYAPYFVGYGYILKISATIESVFAYARYIVG